MTIADIADHITEKVGLSKKESQEIVEVIVNSITDALVSGESVKIPGFGTFIVRSKNSRKGRNPQTGESLEITPRRVITFKTSNQLKETVEEDSVLKVLDPAD